MRGEQRGKNEGSNAESNAKSIHFTCKIKTLFTYLEKLLYLCKSFCKKGGLRINGIQIGINRRAMHAIGYVKVFMWKVLQKSCECLHKVVEDVFGFGEIEFLTDLGLALVDGLETLTSEHIDLLDGEIRFE